MSVRLFEPVAMMNGLCITPSPAWDRGNGLETRPKAKPPKRGGMWPKPPRTNRNPHHPWRGGGQIQGPREIREMPEEHVTLGASTALQKSEMQEIAESLRRGNPDIIGCVILDEKGAIIAHSIPPEIDEEKVSTIFAALRSAAERTAQHIALEKMKQFVIFAERGGAFLQRHGDLFLLLFMKPDAKLGAVLMELGYVIERLEEITRAKS